MMKFKKKFVKKSNAISLKLQEIGRKLLKKFSQKDDEENSLKCYKIIPEILRETGQNCTIYSKAREY